MLLLRLLTFALALAAIPFAARAAPAAQKPNIVIIFADDLGYGDLGCYYRIGGGIHLCACRLNEWKAHFITQPGYSPPRETHEPPLLFHLGRDVGENRDVAKDNPAVLAKIRAAVEAHQAGLTPGEPQFND